MPMPVRPLPTVQNWDCHTCGDCCRTYAVRVTPAEKGRIEQQGWGDTPELKGVPPVVLNKQLGDHTLNQTADGTCVFLGPNNLCRIHAKFGAAAKPFACRLYPFVLVPSGDKWAVSLRYACPSVTDNLGRACSAHAADVTDIAALVEADQPKTVDAPPPELQAGQTVPWDDLRRFTATFAGLVSDPTHPIERRLRQVAALAEACKKSKFDKVGGKRLGEFLTVMSAAVADEVPADPYSVPTPGWTGRVLFRQQAGVYVRQDFGPHAGVGKRGGWARLTAGWKFGIGAGAVPQLHASLPVGVKFAAVEQPLGEPTKEADELFARYFRVKLEAGQFFGPSNFGRGYWDGLDSLLLVFPTVRWAARLMTLGGTDPAAAGKLALRMVDENFGYSKLLAGGRTTWAVRTLAEQGQIPRLIAWYAR